VAGDVRLGAVLEQMRSARGLTLAAVARQAHCSVALLSYVESGDRVVQPWLAGALDRIYRTGSVVASLARGVEGASPGSAASGVSQTDVFVVRLPQGGVAMLLSRRQVAAALGLGIVSGDLQEEFERALGRVDLNSDCLQFFDDAFHGYRKAARFLPPAQLVDGMTGDVAILDGLRRRATGEVRRRCGVLQARYAELLSWVTEEAGDLTGSMWWIDRSSQWAQAVDWSSMTVYGFVRRAMMVRRFSSKGLRAVDHASAVLEMPHASPRMRGLAAHEMAEGYALAGDRDASMNALDLAMEWMAQPLREDDALFGQQISVAADDLYTLHRMTCDVYLGRGVRIIPILEPRLASLSGSSLRIATITRAKLVRAYAHAGQPEDACRVAWEALDGIEQVGSLSARNELRRALPVLNQWHGRDDVQDIAHRLGG